jgi:hypothetical protein
MAKKYSSVRPKITLPPSNRDGDGNHIYNEILLDLPPKESDTLLPKLEFVRLKLHQVLHEAGQTLKSGYFCNTGMFSVLTVTPNGKNVEVGLIGKEGFAGVPLIAGFRTSHTRAVVQAEGTAFSCLNLPRPTSTVSQAGVAATPVFPGYGNASRTYCNLQSAPWS